MNCASGNYSMQHPAPPPHPTRFEELVVEQGLTNREDLWPYNGVLCRFAKRNKSHHYVPEHFLVALGLDSEVEL